MKSERGGRSVASNMVIYALFCRYTISMHAVLCSELCGSFLGAGSLLAKICGILDCCCTGFISNLSLDACDEPNRCLLRYVTQV